MGNMKHCTESVHFNLQTFQQNNPENYETDRDA